MDGSNRNPKGDVKETMRGPRVDSEDKDAVENCLMLTRFSQRPQPSQLREEHCPRLLQRRQVACQDPLLADLVHCSENGLSSFRASSPRFPVSGEFSAFPSPLAITTLMYDLA